jgi:hypothetical protein
MMEKHQAYVNIELMKQISAIINPPKPDVPKDASFEEGDSIACPEADVRVEDAEAVTEGPDVDRPAVG